MNNTEVIETINDSNSTKTPLLEQTCVKLTDADHELFETLQKKKIKTI